MKTTTAKKKGILSVLMLLAGTVVFAQRPSLPVTSAEFAPGTVRRQARAEERAERNARFIARQDSLGQSCNFQFLPVSVLEVPGGGEQTINNIYYYLAVFPDNIEVHLPTLRGYLNPYVEVLNFDAPRPKDYKASKTQSGWNISFNAADGEGNVYTFGINLFTATGEAIMTMLTPRSTIKYVGSLAANEPLLNTPPSGAR